MGMSTQENHLLNFRTFGSVSEIVPFSAVTTTWCDDLQRRNLVSHQKSEFLGVMALSHLDIQQEESFHRLSELCRWRHPQVDPVTSTGNGRSKTR